LSCLFYLFLLVPRLLAGITLVVWLIMLHKITTAIGGGISVAKA
jgi:ABC-type transporter Mla maintaining outer membrane lipid asymmetry permease subunit MlaE